MVDCVGLVYRCLQLCASALTQGRGLLMWALNAVCCGLVPCQQPKRSVWYSNRQQARLCSKRHMWGCLCVGIDRDMSSVGW